MHDLQPEPAGRGASALEERVFAMYDSLPLADHPICRECRRSAGNVQLGRPISLWQAGSRFGCDGRRILFAGKNARGDAGADCNRSFLDATAFGDEHIGKWDRQARLSAYWRYTREIIQACYPDLPFAEAWERVAFTNLLKCNEQEYSTVNDAADRAPWTVAEHCVAKLQVFRREIDLLQPTHIVLCTGRRYDSLLGAAMFGPRWRDAPGSGPEATVDCGGRRLPWWEGFLEMEDGATCRVLRTGHPQCKPREPYVRLISAWLLSA